MIKTIVSLHILLIVLPVCAGTFVDDFEDGNIAGWSAVGEWSVESGELVGENMEPAYDSGGIFFGELTWRNYTIEAHVKLIKSSGDPCAAGMFVRAQHEPGQLPHTFCFGFHQGTCGYTFEPGTVIGLMKSRRFSVGKWYHLKVLADDSHFEFYIDNELIAEFDDQRYPAGRMGLYVFKMKAHFDNIVIVGEDIPGNDSVEASVKQRDKLSAKWGEIKRRY